MRLQALTARATARRQANSLEFIPYDSNVSIIVAVHNGQYSIAQCVRLFSGLHCLSGLHCRN